MSKLSILIPARNEEFLSKTVDDLLEHIEGDTEIIVGLDGQWPAIGLVDDSRVRILYVPEAIGQRALTNQLARLSSAKYVMKVDAHCSFEQGFDVKMMADMQDDWTMVPIMKNLHAFDWVCLDGHRRYQGPSGPCDVCGKPTIKDVVWIAKDSPKSKSYRFDKILHFQYFGEFSKRPEGQGNITPSMSLQGSCFMMTRNKYWELDICDEAHGSWGQQGVEVACKTWLSGGQVMVNQKTWYAHMFRTQGGDFGFPYHLRGGEVEHARKYSRELWLENKWPKAIHDLQWLIDKFSPVPDWETRKGIIFYTDNQLNLKIASKVQRRIKSMGLPIVSSSLKRMDNMGKNVHIKRKRGILTMYKQILAALEASDAEIIYFCEHDVLYHPSHFIFTPPRKDKYYYNHNWWSIRQEDGFAVSWDANRVSQLVAYREFLLDYYRERVQFVEQGNSGKHYEPGGRLPILYEAFYSEFPNIDIRHSGTLTGDKWSLADFRDKTTAKNFQTSSYDKIPGWETGDFSGIINI